MGRFWAGFEIGDYRFVVALINTALWYLLELYQVQEEADGRWVRFWGFARRWDGQTEAETSKEAKPLKDHTHTHTTLRNTQSNARARTQIFSFSAQYPFYLITVTIWSRAGNWAGTKHIPWGIAKVVWCGRHGARRFEFKSCLSSFHGHETNHLTLLTSWIKSLVLDAGSKGPSSFKNSVIENK